MKSNRRRGVCAPAVALDACIRFYTALRGIVRGPQMEALAELPGTQTEWSFTPPAEVLASRLFAAGGYFVVSGLFDEITLEALRAEAEAARPEGVRQSLSESDRTEGRGGSPARAFRSGRGRELHWGLHGSPEMKARLEQLCGVVITPTGSGSFSYYEQPGDFLALHRDILQCDMAVITCLSAQSGQGLSGELTVYPGFMREPLSVARARNRSCGTVVALERGHTAILLGGLIPHEVTPACAGQERIVAINCFRIECAGAGQAIAGESLELVCK
jgi:hypothetical protein